MRAFAMTSGLLLMTGLTGMATCLPAGRLEAIGVQPPPVEEDFDEENHPLLRALKIARDAHRHMLENVRDYTAVMVKRESIKGELGEYQYIFAKIRNERRRNDEVVAPFGVYLKFLKPNKLKGREVIYVKGRNDGRMLAHESRDSLPGKLVSKVSLDPKGLLAMQGNRYPITEIGLANLLIRLIEVAEEDLRWGECEVKFFEGAKVGERSCTKIEVRHPHRRPYFRFHLARIYVDDELQLPIRYEAYDWPTAEGEAAPLIEEYTYTDLKINVGLTDEDFDPANPAYSFSR